MSTSLYADASRCSRITGQSVTIDSQIDYCTEHSGSVTWPASSVLVASLLVDGRWTSETTGYLIQPYVNFGYQRFRLLDTNAIFKIARPCLAHAYGIMSATFTSSAIYSRPLGSIINHYSVLAFENKNNTRPESKAIIAKPNMSNNNLVDKLYEVEKIASASKIKRMLEDPFKYFHAILFREVVYRHRKIEKEVISKTFFDENMHILLPSSTDIYLTGGKSHDSEIRLARFLIDNLANGDTFVDIGAHYGYFTLLGSILVGNEGNVYSFEASPTTYKVLHKNTHDKPNVNSFNLAISNEVANLIFYEFPNLYSEYNTLNIDQFKNEAWFIKHKPKEVSIDSIILDNLLYKENIYPDIIKIDVEGAENKVVEGLSKYLAANSTSLVMEYLSQERGNREHQEAEHKLKSIGYSSFAIASSGHLIKIESIATYLKDNNLESDNIVFAKKEKAHNNL